MGICTVLWKDFIKEINMTSQTRDLILELCFGCPFLFILGIGAGLYVLAYFGFFDKD